jgi:hypothetical protein
MPTEFVRVRYYFGQRLGVLELNDEAVYHLGKLAFHNARLHGIGVLCGLRAERVTPPAGTGTSSTVLRVSRGAALDTCGREVLVGIDQCIDVAAWFARNKNRPELSGWNAAGTRTLRVAVRYRECPSDPSPAPRDPCGCDNGGCEFGRVREGFELGLFTEAEAVCAANAFPDTAALLSALDGAGPAGSGGDPSSALTRAVDTLVAADCPGPGDDRWLCLASFEVTLDATPVPVDISDPDNAIPERRTLLSTGALQAAVLDLYADGATAGTVGAGPRAGALAFTPDAANPTTAGELRLGITLAPSSTPPGPAPLVATTFDPAIVGVEALDVVSGWKDVTPPAASITYDAVAVPPVVRIVFTQDLAAGPAFRLTLDPDFAVPVVDTLGRPLPRVARSFTFVLDASGSLALATSS